MKNISAQTKALIELLNPPASFWERLTGRREDAELLSRVAEAGELAAIVEIAPFVLSERREVAHAAAAAVDKLAASATAVELAQLDLLFRARSPYGGRYRMEWHKLAPAELNKLERFGDYSIALLGMASFHESGFVREEAIKRLDQKSSGFELPFLLIRLNDWVDNVRVAAQMGIISRLQPHYADNFVASLPLVTRLGQAGRSEHRQTVEAIESLLKRTDCRDALLRGLKSPDRSIRRISFSLAVDSTDAASSSILERALADQDTVIRLLAARKVSAEFAGAPLDKFLSRMRIDNFMPVRREALRAFVTRLPEQAPVELRRALLDPHVSMRDEAQYHLRKSESFNLASFYRQALASADNRILSAALHGLGETGSASDDKLLITFTHHPSAKVRRIVIRALSRLNGKAHVSIFTAALQDKTPSVSREARKALLDKASVVGGESLREIFNSSPLRHVRRNVLHLFTRLNKWDSIYFLVSAATDNDEEIAELSSFYVERWLMQFNRRFTQPTQAQLARLSRALKECGHLLDENSREHLWFSMKDF